MPATTVLRLFHSESDPPIVQRLIVEPEEELARRNQQRLEQAKRELGGRYVLHSSNKIIRQNLNQPRKPAARALSSDKLRDPGAVAAKCDPPSRDGLTGPSTR